MKKIVKLTESDLTRIVKRVIVEQSENSLKNIRAEIVTFLNGMSNIWQYSPSHNMSEFAFIPKDGDIAYNGMKYDSFKKYTGKPLIWVKKDGNTTYCYFDKRNNFVLKHLGKKTSTPLTSGFDNIKTQITKISN